MKSKSGDIKQLIKALNTSEKLKVRKKLLNLIFLEDFLSNKIWEYDKTTIGFSQNHFVFLTEAYFIIKSIL